MEFEDGQEDEGPLFPWLPPEDRLWRHPSEVGDAGAAGGHRPPSHRALSHHAVRHQVTRLWTVALLAGVAGALVVSGLFVATGSLRQRTVIEPLPPDNATLTTDPSPDPPQPTQSGDWTAIAEDVSQSVVSVQLEGNGPEVGSGVIFKAVDGFTYVITADDLFTNGRSNITVSFSNGATVAAKWVGADAVSGIAVLAVRGTNFQLPQFGSVSTMRVADQVMAVGARTTSQDAVQSGLVASLDTGLASSTGTTMLGLISVTGVSTPQAADGGALVDADDEVIGINTDMTAANSNQENVDYAIPFDLAEHIADQLVAGVKPTHPWIGVDGATDAVSKTGGAVVGSVQPGSPASLAGIRTGDIITRFYGQPVTTSGSLVTLLAECTDGQSAGITWLHNGVSHTATVRVTEQPAEPDL